MPATSATGPRCVVRVTRRKILRRAPVRCDLHHHMPAWGDSRTRCIRLRQPRGHLDAVVYLASPSPVIRRRLQYRSFVYDAQQVLRSCQPDGRQCRRIALHRYRHG